MRIRITDLMEHSDSIQLLLAVIILNVYETVMWRYQIIPQLVARRRKIVTEPAVGKVDEMDVMLMVLMWLLGRTLGHERYFWSLVLPFEVACQQSENSEQYNEHH
jgi:hypothetical protein